jgi:hypothetical protein
MKHKKDKPEPQPAGRQITLHPTVLGPVKWIPCQGRCGRHIRIEAAEVTGGYCRKCFWGVITPERSVAGEAASG